MMMIIIIIITCSSILLSLPARSNKLAHTGAKCRVVTQTSKLRFNTYDRGVPEKTQPVVARACRVTLHVRPGDWLRPQPKKRKKNNNRKQILVRIAEDRSVPRACAERGCQPAIVCCTNASQNQMAASCKTIRAPREWPRTNHRQSLSRANLSPIWDPDRLGKKIPRSL
jgi:hypothetical protein